MKLIKNLTILLTLLILSLIIYLKINLEPKVIVPEIKVNADKDWDLIPDNLDIVEGARWEVKNKTTYKSWYYSGGFPPKNEWVCTDVIWRALKNAGYDLKSMIDKDIQKNIWAYKRVNWKPDPNIDFRRVPNLHIYLKRNAISLTTKVIPWNVDNLVEWQAWDIVIFWNHWNNKAKNQTKALDHTAIISDKRNRAWVPYIIHNAAPVPREEDWLIYWNENVSKIIGHYRLKY
jgi:uncharacterized protein YijF (DUF1287 family)